MDLLKIAEEAFATGKTYPEFKAGDTVTVAYRIVEGNKERIQQYRGIVIKICGHGEKKRFTVRKMSGTVGVERIFPIESPHIDSIEVNKVGKVRRAKLYYLRELKKYKRSVPNGLSSFSYTSTPPISYFASIPFSVSLQKNDSLNDGHIKKKLYLRNN